MIRPPALITYASAIGDIISLTPTIRKLSAIYNKKVLVVTQKLGSYVLKNLPYISNILELNDELNSDIERLYDVHETFKFIGKRDNNGIEFKHAICDIRQYHAKDLGFLLKPSELHCDYIPTEGEDHFKSLDLPENYIVVHPVQTWESRTFDLLKWQDLCNRLADLNIYVVAIGKDSVEYRDIPKTKKIDKPSHNINLKLGIDLTNKTNLDQTWHLLNNSKMVITMDSGILHLSGTTDTHIVQLGSSIDPVYRAPYRNGTQEYKYTYILGECGIYCASDLRYSLRDWENIQNVTTIDTCLEMDKNFECKPGVDQIIKNVLEIYNKLIKYEGI